MNNFARVNRMPTFKERFWSLKAEKDVSLEVIAKAIGSNKSSLSMFINGRSNIRQEMIEALANYFGVTQSYLLGESDNPYMDEKIPQDYFGVIKSAIERGITPDELKVFLKLIEDYKKQSQNL